jgi:manganese transport protein
MDPGNWATDLEGGARFGYQLLWVLVLSNLIALLLQTLSARLGLVSGLDLASACREGYSRGVNVTLWLAAEVAIIACDLAELLGSALALNLLFGMPLVVGAVVTSFDVLAILWLERRGARRLEAVVFTLLLTIALCLATELVWARPQLRQLSAGLVPRLNAESLYVAIGILGATVMPHNLYLQSGLLQRTGVGMTAGDQRGALRRSFWSTALALNLALLVNGAILVLAGTVFAGRQPPVNDLRDAYHLLAPLLGASSASVLFAVGLLCSGQSATVTGTLAGQLVMEGFMRLRVRPWLRRLITRAVAIFPAVFVLSWVGERGSLSLLVASQVVLSLQLPFAIVPLIRLTSAPHVMGPYATRPLLRNLASAFALLIIAANAALVIRLVEDSSATSPALAGGMATLGSVSLGFLAWVAFIPLRGAPNARLPAPHRPLEET